MGQPQSNNAARRIMSMKNSNETFGNQTHDLPTCRAVPQPTAPAHTPYTKEIHSIKASSCQQKMANGKLKRNTITFTNV
jgi:hypothetical protein